MSRGVRHFLFDILEHIRRCEHLMAGKSVDDLEGDFATRMAVERAIEIISEASRHIADADKATEPDQPWRNIADIGNRLRHAYHLTAVEQIHFVATEGLAALKPAVERLYQKHKRPEDPWPDAASDAFRK
ncbi:MAG: DUF86 domain-containing protein [Alphaproteobacteria bacterium]|nr:DUF86 domain-containing protein [Alphaproteobacteria bacterium]MBU2378708.1 DUF86 domain-containing protein [Alphaproteobacteria bacterium]